MRVLNARTYQFRDHVQASDIRYVALSHTWAPEGEVTYQDMMLPSTISLFRKSPDLLSLSDSFSKILQTCRLAVEAGLEYVWIDTCCIDKSSSAELTETINSMFDLYKKAEICFVYLEDLHPQTSLRDGLNNCRWVTRGWTLQELIAPANVQFYDQSWECRGSKHGWAGVVSEATGIHLEALRGDRPPREFSIAQRMYWGSARQTTRTEDLAYCLLGIFGVHMPLIYGEGIHAFCRLQEEIVKRSNDLTIFAWNEQASQATSYCLFAASPSSFATGGTILSTPFFYTPPEFSFTNRGLKLNSRIYGLHRDISLNGGPTQPTFSYFLCVGAMALGSNKLRVVIALDKVGPDNYIRRRDVDCCSIPDHLFHRPFYISSTARPASYVVVDDDPNSLDYTVGSLQFLPSVTCGMDIQSVPDKFWDIHHQLFFGPDSASYVFVVSSECRIGPRLMYVMVICKYEYDPGAVPTLRICNSADFEDLSQWLLDQRFKEDCPRWTEVLAVESRAGELTDELEIDIDGIRYLVWASVRQLPLENSSGKRYTATLYSRIKGRISSANVSDDDSESSGTFSSSSSDSGGGCTLD